MKFLFILLFAFGAPDQEVISQTSCMFPGAKSLEEVKAELLVAARRGAVEQLFGSLVTSLSQVDDLVLKKDQIRAASIGYVRLVGNPLFFNGDSLGEVCVKIQAYATAEDRAKLKPRELTKKSCVAEGDVGTIRKRAEEKAIYEALTDYDATLKRFPVSRVSPLLHEVRFSEGDFVKDALTYCVRASGTLYPIEAAAIALQGQTEQDQMHTTAPAPRVDITGSWEFSYRARKAWDNNGAIRDNSQKIDYIFDLKQDGERISGSIVGATGSACREATINGNINNLKIRWTITYRGQCCQDSELLFSGEIDQSSGDPVIRGTIEPKSKPPGGSCELWWADVFGSKRL